MQPLPSRVMVASQLETAVAARHDNLDVARRCRRVFGGLLPRLQAHLFEDDGVPPPGASPKDASRVGVAGEPKKRGGRALLIPGSRCPPSAQRPTAGSQTSIISTATRRPQSESTVPVQCAHPEALGHHGSARVVLGWFGCICDPWPATLCPAQEKKLACVWLVASPRPANRDWAPNCKA